MSNRESDSGGEAISQELGLVPEDKGNYDILQVRLMPQSI